VMRPKLHGAILRTVAPGSVPTGVRYASIHEFKRRINVVKSVEKITASMKMVAAAKLKIAQQRVEPAVAFNNGTARMFEGLVPDEQEAALHVADMAAQPGAKASSKHLIVVITTDRGLCGAVTGNAVRRAIEEIKTQKLKEGEIEICSVGTKGQDGMAGLGYAKALGIVGAELGTKPPAFGEVAYLADALLQTQPKSITVVYNHFVNLLTNNLVSTRLLSLPNLKAATKWQETEFDDEDCFQSLSEFQFAAILWAAILENATVEQAVRMSSMDSAASNAGEIVKDLTLRYNKTRQSVITTELSEIVSGMTAIMEG